MSSTIASPVTVRQAVTSDLAALVTLFDAYRQFYAQDSEPAAVEAFLQARFAKGDSTLFIAHAAGTPAGFAQLYPSFSSVRLARTFILNDIFVDPACRRRGVGAALIDAAVAYGKGQEAVRLTLSTAISNSAAQALYATKGWQRDEQFFVYHYALS